jgi:hypothetical protein
VTRTLARCAALALALAAVTTPAASMAATTALGGSPLNVQIGDLGRLQAFRTDRAENNGIFFPSISDSGDAGLFIALPEDSGTVYGFPVTSGLTGITSYTPVSQTPVSGSGTAANPLTQVTTYNAGSIAGITQTTTYVNGSQEFRVRWEVTNTSAAPLKLKAMGAADFFFEGSDRGTGIFTVGPPRFIGGTNVDSGSSGGFVEVLPGSEWSSYQALAWGDGPNELWGKVNASAGSSGATFDGSVVGEPVDNAGAVEWDQYATTGLPATGPAATAVFEVIVRSAVPSALQLNPTAAGSRQGVPVNVTATAIDTNGQPYAGKTLRYTITGANPGSGAVALNAAGAGVITDPGTNAGDDTIIAYVDFNNSEARDTVEPQASALATFVDGVPPTCTIKVRGDRVGGAGSGRPLIVTVNCGEPATVTVSTKLTVPSRRGTSSRRARAIKLRSVTHVVAPGKRFAFKLKLPRKVARKYAGRKLRAVTTVTAKDQAGNVKRVRKRSTIRVRPLAHRRPGR